ARKRRSAETHNTNPTSSFRRRFRVGVKIFEKNVMWQRRRCWGKTSPDSAATRPELNNYDKKRRFLQCGKRGGVASWVPATKGADAAARERGRSPIRTCRWRAGRPRPAAEPQDGRRPSFHRVTRHSAQHQKSPAISSTSR